MNQTDIVKAKRIRTGLAIVSMSFCLVGLFCVYYPRFDSGDVRVASATIWLTAAVLWILPTIPRMSLSRCASALVAVNVVLLTMRDQIDRLLYNARWEAIYREVGQLSRTSPFDFDRFSSSLGQALRGGFMLDIGISAIWSLNIVALIYLAQTERDKEAANKASDATSEPAPGAASSSPQG